MAFFDDLRKYIKQLISSKDKQKPTKFIKVVTTGYIGQMELLHRIVHGEYCLFPPTIGVKQLTMRHKNIELQLWSTGSSRPFLHQRQAYLKKADIIIVGMTFDYDEYPIKEARDISVKNNIPVIFVEENENLTEVKFLRRDLQERRKLLQKRYKIPCFFRISNKTGDGIADLKFYLQNLAEIMCQSNYKQTSKIPTPDEIRRQRLWGKELLSFALTSKRGLLLIQDIATNNATDRKRAIRGLSPDVTKYMLGFLGTKECCERIIYNISEHKSLFEPELPRETQCKLNKQIKAF